MAYIAPSFTTTAVINADTLIKDTDEQLQLLMADSGTYLETQAQAVFNDLDDEMATYLSLENKVFAVATVEDLATVPSTYLTCIVKDLNRGGTFIWSATSTANGGTVFAGATGYWIRQYSGAVNVKWFGAKGDGVTDDTLAIQSSFLVVKLGGILLLTEGEYLISGTIGNDSNNPTDFCSDVTIFGYGATLLISNDGITNIVALRLEGNNCHIKGISITSEKSIDHTQDPSSFRSNYLDGVVLGGKYVAGNPAIGDSTYLRKNVSITDCVIYNVNRPIQIKRASNVNISNNTIEEYTDTGVAILDCVENINIDKNKITKGSDDNIACINYKTSFYVNGTTNYTGGINITNNELGYTFGKFLAIAGYSDISFTGNICNYSWATGIGYENGESSAWSSRIIDNRRFVVDNNIINNAGGYFDISYWRTTAFPSVKETSAMSGAYNSSRLPYPFKEIAFTNNTVYGALTYGISLINVQDVLVSGNRFVNNKASGLSAVYIESTDVVTISGNTLRGVGFNFPYCYSLYNNNGTLTLASIEIHRNTEAYATAILQKTSFEEPAIHYTSNRISGFNGTITSYGSDLTAERYAFKSQGGGSNLNILHRAGLSPYIFNTSGSGLNLCTDSNGASAGNLGVSVPANAPEKLTVNGNISAYSDNVNSCGTAARRWSTVYAATGTINTSDITSKTFYDIEEAEMLCAKELKSMMRKFRFNDAIDSKGESEARIHFGVGAQYVRDVFIKYELDPFKYALLCYDSWDEVLEEKDEEGNVITEYVPAGDRYGIRYDELICFIISVM